MPCQSDVPSLISAYPVAQINLLRSIDGRGVAKSAVGPLQVHTFHLAQHHKSDNGQQAPVLGVFFSSGDHAPKYVQGMVKIDQLVPSI
jgi:hypothetical protein